MQCKGPCLPHCYSDQLIIFFIGLILGVMITLIIINYNNKHNKSKLYKLN